MKLDEIDPRATAYVLDELDMEERKQFEVAIQEDPALQQAVNQLYGAAKLMNEVFTSAECPTLAPDAAARILAKADAAASTAPRFWRGFLAASAIAAAALIACMVAISVLPTATPQQQLSDNVKSLKRANDAELQEQLKSLGYGAAEPTVAKETGSRSNEAKRPDELKPQLKQAQPDASSRAGSSLQNVQVGGEIRIRDTYFADPGGAGAAQRVETMGKERQNSADNSSTGTAEPEQKEQLEALGYMGETIAASPTPTGSATTPNNSIGDLDDFQVNTGGSSASSGKTESGNRTFGLNRERTSSFNWQFGKSNMGGGGGGDPGFVEQRAQIGRKDDIEIYQSYIPPDDQAIAGGQQDVSALEFKRKMEPIRLDFGLPISSQGQDHRQLGARYEDLAENSFVQVAQEPLSTFSMDVDTASYANVRAVLTANQLPPPQAVRLEEFVNAFCYEYAGPTDGSAVAVHADIAGCPWNSEHRIARVAVKAKEIPWEMQPPLRLTFLIDVSGSMDQPRKLPLLKEALKALVQKLRPADQIAIVTYSDTASVALKPTALSEPNIIISAIDALTAGGSTNGAGGLDLAYSIANEQLFENGLNSVILATDGDFNVGETESIALAQRIQDQAKRGVFLTVLGFGIDNLQDNRLETLADKGNGAYYFIDDFAEARRVLVERVAGTLAVAAKDAKIQVEFNPAKVSAYRLLGYENRALAAQDFNDDRKDAGELGSGHTVTALYELVPYGASISGPMVDVLKYQPVPAPPANGSTDTMTVKLRYKDPNASESRKIEMPVTDTGARFEDASRDFQWASAVAAFAMILRGSQYSGTANLDLVQRIAEAAAGGAPERTEFVSLVVTAKTLVHR